MTHLPLYKRRQIVRQAFISLTLVIAAVCVYLPVRHHGFVNLDDDDYVTANAHVQSGLTLRGLVWALTTNHAATWHPVTWLSHMLDWQLWRDRAGAHHLVNVLFHVANALLLFGVLSRMTASAVRSALVAGLFALHPLHVESVAWVSERKDVLSTCFWLLTLWAYVRYIGRPSGWRYFSVLGLYALGLMAKPMVITLPFVLLLLDYWPLGRTRWAKSVVGENVSTPPSQLIREKLPFLALGAISGALTYWAACRGGAMAPLVSMPVGTRIANVLVSYVGYVGKMFWPTGLAVLYPLHAGPSAAAATVAGIGLVGVTIAVIWGARRGPWFVTGWFWYLGTLVPVIGLVQVWSQSMADRYTYVPSIGLFIMLCWSVPSRAMERRNLKVITYAAAVALLAVCAALSRVQIEYWKDSETLFRHALDVTRDNWLAHDNLGAALLQTGRLQEAIEQCEEALRIKSDDAKAHNNLGAALQQTGRLQEAIGQYEQALRIEPDDAEVHVNLGSALSLAGRFAEGIAQYEQALRIKPDDAKTYYNLGLTLSLAGRFAEGIAQYEQALRIKPDYAKARHNLGSALQQTGRLQEAIGQYEQALRIEPDDAEVHVILGLALEKTGRTPEAIGHYEQALRIKSDYAGAHYNLGNALLHEGNVSNSLAHYEQALRITPDSAEVQNNLAWVLATYLPANGGDPARAVTLAERACELSGNRLPVRLDTLAAAYAAAGRFNDAVATAQKAVDLARSAGQPEIAKEIESRLKLYREGNAYRQPAHLTSPSPFPI